MPDDPTFSQTNNKYDEPSYKRICNEFGVNPSSDFCFTHGANHSLEGVYIYVPNLGPSKTLYNYPGKSKFSDEGGASKKGNLVFYIEPDDDATHRQTGFPLTVQKG